MIPDAAPTATVKAVRQSEKIFSFLVLKLRRGCVSPDHGHYALLMALPRNPHGPSRNPRSLWHVLVICAHHCACFTTDGTPAAS